MSRLVYNELPFIFVYNNIRPFNPYKFFLLLTEGFMTLEAVLNVRMQVRGHHAPGKLLAATPNIEISLCVIFFNGLF